MTIGTDWPWVVAIFEVCCGGAWIEGCCCTAGVASLLVAGSCGAVLCCEPSLLLFVPSVDTADGAFVVVLSSPLPDIWIFFSRLRFSGALVCGLRR